MAELSPQFTTDHDAPSLFNRFAAAVIPVHEDRTVHYRMVCVILDMSQARDMLCSSIVIRAEDNRTQILRQWLHCSSYGRLVGGTVAWDAEESPTVKHGTGPSSSTCSVCRQPINDEELEHLHNCVG